MPQDHYALLGIARDAGADEIRRAYRRLASRLHPDRNPGDPHAEARFRDVTEAYAVLSDTAKRTAYDARASSVPAVGAAVFVSSAKPRGRRGRAEVAAEFRNAMKPGTMYEVRTTEVRVGPVPVVSAPAPSMPQVPLWMKGRR
jgi:DnaJ-class molecular chaperone